MYLQVFEELQAVDRDAWRAEVLGHEELFLDLHAYLPKEMVYEGERDGECGECAHGDSMKRDGVGTWYPSV